MKRTPLKRTIGTLKWKPLNRTGSLKKKPVSPDKIAERKLLAEQDKAFYEKIWANRPHFSEVSGKPLYNFTKMYFHHIIPKSKWDEGRHLEENIILLTPEEHGKVENDKYYFEEVNKRRDSLKLKFGI